MSERAGERTGGTGAAIKRRGLIAGAAALVAGMVAAKTSQPVAATTGGTNGSPLIIGANGVFGSGNTPNTFTAPTELLPTTGSSIPFDFSRGALTGVGKDNDSGLIGVSYGVDGRGVEGITDSGYGVVGFGTSSSATTSTGVFGVSSGSTGYGVYGSASGSGGTAVYGGVSGTAPGVSGRNTSAAATAGPGAQGVSDHGHGAVGVSGATDGHAALFGYTNQSGGDRRARLGGPGRPLRSLHLRGGLRRHGGGRGQPLHRRE